jgi:hypothetical protein
MDMKPWSMRALPLICLLIFCQRCHERV